MWHRLGRHHAFLLAAPSEVSDGVRAALMGSLVGSSAVSARADEDEEEQDGDPVSDDIQAALGSLL